VEVRAVTIGRTSEGEAVIAKGLAAGEQVVREGQFLLGAGSRIEIKDPTKVADEVKGEGRRGRGKTDGSSKDGVKAAEAAKGEGRRERATAEGEIREAGKSGEESKGEGRRRRRGEGKGKPEGEARGKGESRGES